MADSIMKAFGAKPEDYVIKINNRNLINFMMANYLGLDNQSAQAMVKLIDKKNKIAYEDFEAQAKVILGENYQLGLQNLTDLIEAKTMADLPDTVKNSSIIKEIQALFTLLEQADVTSVRFDHTLMRGLEYYTGIVFEVFDTHPDNSRSLFGGGRYDGLVGLFGAEPISAVGMAPGATMIENFLIVHKLVPDLKSHTNAFITVIGEQNIKHANNLAKYLRDNGLNIEVDITDRKVDRQIKSALKKQIPTVIFVGENEALSEVYIVKNLSDQTESSLSADEIVSYLGK